MVKSGKVGWRVYKDPCTVLQIFKSENIMKLKVKLFNKKNILQIGHYFQILL